MRKNRVKRHEVVQPQGKPYRFIPLTQGQNAIVDVDDFAWLSKWNWYAQWNEFTKSFYAVRTVNFRDGRVSAVRMSREILGSLSGKEADHKNRNTLDNRRSNLRDATRSQNQSNKDVHRISASGYRGVYSVGNRKWVAQIRHHKVCVYLDRFLSVEEAAQAYDEAAKKYHGEFAVLNFT